MFFHVRFYIFWTKSGSGLRPKISMAEANFHVFRVLRQWGTTRPNMSCLIRVGSGPSISASPSKWLVLAAVSWDVKIYASVTRRNLNSNSFVRICMQIEVAAIGRIVGKSSVQDFDIVGFCDKQYSFGILPHSWWYMLSLITLKSRVSLDLISYNIKSIRVLCKSHKWAYVTVRYIQLTCRLYHL